MTLEEISNLQFNESVAYILISRLFDVESLVDKEQPIYVVSYDNMEDSFYDRLSLHSELTKPTLLTFQTELDLYKLELTVNENARLAELARVEDIKNRFNSIKGIHQVLSDAGNPMANAALELKRIIEQDDQAKLAEYEAIYVPIKEKQDRKERLQATAEIGRKDRAICEEVLSIIGGLNRQKTLTKEQIDSMVSSFASALNALTLNRPDSAKEAIQAIVPDEVLITSDDVDDILFVFNEKGY